MSTTPYPHPKTVAEAIDTLGLQDEFLEWVSSTSDRFGFIVDVVAPDLQWPPDVMSDEQTDDELYDSRMAVAKTLGRFAWAGGVRAALLAAANTYLKAMKPKEESTTTTPFADDLADEIVDFMARSSVECDKLIDDLAPELRLEHDDMDPTEINRRLDAQRALTQAIADGARLGIARAIEAAIMARMQGNTEGGPQ